MTTDNHRKTLSTRSCRQDEHLINSKEPTPNSSNSMEATKWRSRSLSELPGHIKVPIIRRKDTSRTQARLDAGVAGLAELRELREQHTALVKQTMNASLRQRQTSRGKPTASQRGARETTTKHQDWMLGTQNWEDQNLISSNTWSSRSSLYGISEEGIGENSSGPTSSYISSKRPDSRRSSFSSTSNPLPLPPRKEYATNTETSQSSGDDYESHSVSFDEASFSSSITRRRNSCSRIPDTHIKRSHGRASHKDRQQDNENHQTDKLQRYWSFQNGSSNELSNDNGILYNSSSSLNQGNSGTPSRKRYSTQDIRRNSSCSSLGQGKSRDYGADVPQRKFINSSRRSSVDSTSITRLSNSQDYMSWDNLLQLVGIQKQTYNSDMEEEEEVFTLHNDTNDSQENYQSTTLNTYEKDPPNVEQRPIVKTGRSLSFCCGYSSSLIPNKSSALNKPDASANTDKTKDLTKVQANNQHGCLELNATLQKKSTVTPKESEKATALIRRSSIQCESVITGGSSYKRKIFNPLHEVDMQAMRSPGPLHAVTLQYKSMPLSSLTERANEISTGLKSARESSASLSFQRSGQVQEAENCDQENTQSSTTPNPAKTVRKSVSKNLQPILEDANAQMSQTLNPGSKAHIDVKQLKREDSFSKSDSNLNFSEQFDSVKTKTDGCYLTSVNENRRQLSHTESYPTFVHIDENSIEVIQNIPDSKNNSTENNEKPQTLLDPNKTYDNTPPLLFSEHIIMNTERMSSDPHIKRTSVNLSQSPKLPRHDQTNTSSNSYVMNERHPISASHTPESNHNQSVLPTPPSPSFMPSCNSNCVSSLHSESITQHSPYITPTSHFSSSDSNSSSPQTHIDQKRIIADLSHHSRENESPKQEPTDPDTQSIPKTTPISTDQSNLQSHADQPQTKNIANTSSAVSNPQNQSIIPDNISREDLHNTTTTQTAADESVILSDDGYSTCDALSVHSRSSFAPSSRSSSDWSSLCSGSISNVSLASSVFFPTSRAPAQRRSPMPRATRFSHPGTDSGTVADSCSTSYGGEGFAEKRFARSSLPFVPEGSNSDTSASSIPDILECLPNDVKSHKNNQTESDCVFTDESSLVFQQSKLSTFTDSKPAALESEPPFTIEHLSEEKKSKSRHLEATQEVDFYEHCTHQTEQNNFKISQSSTDYSVAQETDIDIVTLEKGMTIRFKEAGDWGMHDVNRNGTALKDKDKAMSKHVQTDTRSKITKRRIPNVGTKQTAV